MTFEPNIKCLWQHPTTSNHLDVTWIEGSEVSHPIVITAQKLKQLQPGNWKISIKPRSDELTSLLPTSQEFTKFPQFKNTHRLSRHLVKKNSSISVNLQPLTTRLQFKIELKLNQFNGWGELFLRFWFAIFLVIPVLFRHNLWNSCRRFNSSGATTTKI